MYHEDTEILFPHRVIPDLHGQRGPGWDKLVEQLRDQDGEAPDTIAFVMMMARLNGCLSCNADSFRAMKGCTACAQDSVRRHRGDDKEMQSMFDKARKDTDDLLNG
jgi:hypothetical protein